jgi:hypothetical protein
VHSTGSAGSGANLCRHTKTRLTLMRTPPVKRQKSPQR